MKLLLYYRETAEPYARWLLDGLASGESLRVIRLTRKQADYRTPVDQFFPYRMPGLVIVDDEAKRIVCAVEISAHAPMGQNPNQMFDKAVGCARLGVPYITMFPFSAEVRRVDASSSVENASGEFFYALRCLRDFHRTTCVAIPWPGSYQISNGPFLSPTGVPAYASAESRDLFTLVDSIVTNYESTGVTEPSATPALERWNQVVDSLGVEPTITPQSRRSYSIIPTSNLGDYLREFFAVQDHELAALPASILERQETVLVSTESRTFRGDPYAGTMFVYDYSLCRTEAAISTRKRNIMPHFRTVNVRDALQLFQRAPIRISRRGDLYFAAPEGASREVLRQVPSAARQFLIGADALLFADGAIIPDRFLLPSATVFSPPRPRNDTSRLILFVEGSDISLLDRVAKVLGYPAISSHPSIEVVSMGGGDQTSYVKATMRVFASHRRGSGKLRGFVIKDRDYKPRIVHDRLCTELQKYDVEVHVWERKEIENYLLTPSLLAKALKEAVTVDTLPRQAVLPSEPLPSEQELESLLMQVTEDLRNHTASRVIYFQTLVSSGDNQLPQIIEQTLNDFDQKWGTLTGRLALVGGKEALAAFRSWVQATYKVSLTYGLLLRVLSPEDLAPEVVDVVKRIFELAGDT